MSENISLVLILTSLAAAGAFLLHLKGFEATEILAYLFLFVVVLVLNIAGSLLADRMGVTNRGARIAVVYGTVLVGVLLCVGIGSMFA